MAKVSRELSTDLHRYAVGMHGGRSPKDINGPGENELKARMDMDEDGKPDAEVSDELSEESNWLK